MFSLAHMVAERDQSYRKKNQLTHKNPDKKIKVNIYHYHTFFLKIHFITFSQR